MKWETLYETNCKEFIIERSTDNNHFSEIKNVPAVGNSIQANEYKTYDTNLSDGKYFYRLKVISTNGAIFYSESQIIEIGQSVRNQENLNIKSVFPNPFSNKFTVSYHLNTDAISKFRLISTTGQTLFTSEKQDLAGENTFEYNDELRLPPGYYLLNVISGTQTFTSKVYKNAY